MSSKFTLLIGYKIATLAKTKREFVDICMEKLQLSRTQWQIMVRLCILDTPCTQSSLLISMEIDRAQLARSLEQLEHKELIKRNTIKEDRRGLEIQLTESGQNLLVKVMELMQYESDILFKNISPKEQQIFITLIDKITSNILTELKDKRNQINGAV
jgi:DNA-binding MarR family transcriptional regulator